MIQVHIQFFSKNLIEFHHATTVISDNTPGFIPLESHHNVEMHYLISGYVEYIIDGTTYPLSPGDLILLPSNTLHSLKFQPGAPYERMVLEVPPDILPVLQDLDILSVFNTAKIFAYVIPQIFVHKSAIPTLFDELCKTCSTPDDKFIDLHVLSIFYKLVEELNYIVEELKKTTDLKPSAFITNKHVHACTQYVSQNISSQLSVDNIANALHLSSSYLTHVFKKEIGISLKKYVNLQKLSLAHKLLQQGHSPQEIASSLGYEYYSTFYKQYSKKYKISPNDIATRPSIVHKNLRFK